jgi:hypothetical protein
LYYYVRTFGLDGDTPETRVTCCPEKPTYTPKFLVQGLPSLSYRSETDLTNLLFVLLGFQFLFDISFPFGP